MTKLALLTPLLFLSAALALPVPGHIQYRLEKLEVSILGVVNGINSHEATFTHADYHAGEDHFNQLLGKLSGSFACSSSTASYQADSEDRVVDSLLSARRNLLELADELVADDKLAAESILTDVCRAFDHYRAVHPYIKSL
ncbi:hypothetical protein BDY17DRAFT_304755 [Neohortaea acidophila]|uniref:Hydrophobic surface binding protein A-domain-containing protein n=1 Tax=Neohortaea acidophila TaxID=245834 RepID=A0A6A6PI71_9PEZI|nr:uncharacterized protein BDY17DRAFT_304755 [Neohortaea acidophila]KAF2478957.1 hypothetical protein BDY17DRAFT_304755 [Neohortaea acidophila]